MSLVRPTHAVLRGPGALSAYFAEHGYALPHPIALLFPRIMGLGQEALTESIRKAGIRDNITVFGDRIADGIARCESGITLGIPWKQIPKTEFVGDETALLQFVIEKNVNRRHLDESQRAMVAARIATMKQGARTDLARICAMSQPQAAELLNVGRRSVQYAVVVLDHGVLELQDAVNDGILSVSAASKVTKLPGNQQRAIVVKSLAQPKPAKAFGAAIRNAEIQSRHRQIVADARLHDLAGKRYFILLVDVPWDVPWDGFEPYAGSPYPLLSNEQFVNSGSTTVDSFARSRPTMPSCFSGLPISIFSMSRRFFSPGAASSCATLCRGQNLQSA